MKTLDRYIIKELSKIFLLSVLILTFVLFIDKIMYLTELTINKGIGLTDVLKLLVYVSPAFLALTIPMGVLISSLITFNRMSSDSEVIAMKSTGVSLYRMLSPVFILSLAAYLTCNVMMMYLLPLGNASFKNLIFEILRTQAKVDIKERIFFSGFDGLVIYVTEKPMDDFILKGVFISDTREEGNEQTIYAKEGIIISDNEQMKVGIKLKDGVIHRELLKKDEFQFVNFSTYNLYINIKNPLENKNKILKGNRELGLSEIIEKINKLKESGKTYYPESVELHKKFSIPFTCFILGLIGVPLGIKSSRTGRAGGFAISLGIILFYYVMLIGGESVGSSGKIYPFIAIWIPNFVLAVIGCYLVWKVGRESPFTLVPKITNFIKNIKYL